jgi:hypothetical protein
MSINHDNYELFFMLYIDNELSVAERKAVEEFIAGNPGLQEELVQLQQLVLPADDIVFDNKQQLYRSAADGSFQSALFMHLDDELDGTAAADMDQLIASDKKLQAEWALLQQTKLDAADQVIFTDKASLYRKEKDRVIVGRFVRWAVAAALIGVGFFTRISLLKNDTTPAETATTNNNTGGKELAGTNKGSKDTNTIAAQEPGTTGKTGTTNITVPQDAPLNIASATEGKTKPQTLVAKETKQANNSIQRKNSTDDNEVLAANNISPKRIEKVSPERDEKELLVAAASPKIKAAPVDITDRNVTPLGNEMARTAGLTDMTEGDNGNHILYMNEEKVTRTKAGGFLRKLKRVIERNTNIKTDNGFRIAGFEIASK